MNYYNEIDPHAAAWLRELIHAGLIPVGDVDERSIVDVQASDLKSYTQHHFFAGIGGWSLALQMAGWPTNKPVCTASLPCQPFSQAGKQRGKQDERHLLPHFIKLVKQGHWRTIFGEQVPTAIKHGWLDDLCTEMEMENYTVGSAILTASGSGAPHIRQRLYWVAHMPGQLPHTDGRSTSGSQEDGGMLQPERPDTTRRVWVVNPTGTGLEGDAGQGISREIARPARASDSGGRMGDPQHDGHTADPVGRGTGESETEGGVQQPERPDTDWANSEWLYCRDKKYRPVKSGLKPLVDGFPKRVVRSGNTGAPINADQTREAYVMRLKGYGNAIVPQVAANFINAYMQVVGYD